MAKLLADETIRLLTSGKIREPTTRGILFSEAPAWNKPTKSKSTRYRILDVGSFEAAAWLLEHNVGSSSSNSKVCVLDFASDTEPGGGWRGNQTGTQEESLCRASSLGLALERLQYPIPPYGFAHIPDVVVLRGGAKGALLDTPFHVSVIAAALRDVGGDGEPDAKQRAHLEKKVTSVLAAMASYGYEHIILGSWGCGAFGNSPTLVARAFADALSGPFANVFATVTFPELRKPGRAAFGLAFASLGVETVSVAAAGADTSGDGGGPPPARRGLSSIYGAGASKHSEDDLIEWQEAGMLAQDAARRKDWSSARRHFERCVELRPEWSKGQACLDKAIAKEHEAQQEQHVAQPHTSEVVVTCVEEAPTAADDAAGAPEAVAAVAPAKVKGVKLLPHEQELVKHGLLTDVTHEGATAMWLRAESTQLDDGPMPDVSDHGSSPPVPLTAVYRPMNDEELSHLLMHGVLPTNRPYQTIVRGEEGRAYAEKYLRGTKWVNTSPTTVVEFVCPADLIEELFAMQCKPEEGALSHGLGDKGGKGLAKFNASLSSGASRHRIVLVKRKASPQFRLDNPGSRMSGSRKA